ncbi:MAG TPA: serine hydroxymethyltransferase [Patescibacteria group bacterium]|nr:serine hydroxymethyltransferase [Patescibacteria group bacterium]
MSALKKTDSQIYELIKDEEKRQKDVLEMIPSENYTSRAVMETLGSVLTNKYSEGYPRKRYYQGNEVIDSVEEIAQERAKKLFGVPYVNVQPYSGSPANAAIYMSILKPGQKLMGLALAHGGHITHGLEVVGFSGTFYKTAHYTVNKKTRQLDYDEVERQVLAEKPDLLICGFTAYSRIIDWARFRKIADKVGCFLMADMSHITGLVIGGVHPSPVPYTDVVMTTTHKTLRGPRGAMIMITDRGIKKDAEWPRRLNTAVFPGLQGGPHDNQTAAIAVALKEAATPAFKKYAEQIVKNARALADGLMARGYEVVSGGTDNHLVLVDLQNKKMSGKIAAEALEAAGIILNYNLVPYDPMPPMYTSGIRMGTPALTTRGLKEIQMEKIADWMDRALREVNGFVLSDNKDERTEQMKKYRLAIAENKNLAKIAQEIKQFITKYPVP